MVSEVRVYIEGDSSLREGFNVFFRDLVNLARARKIRWNLILCGTRHQTYKSFVHAIADHPQAFNVLLVDAEEPVNFPPWEHLNRRIGDQWPQPQGVDDTHCHFMVQTMEAWFVADPQALRGYYQDKFHENLLPATHHGQVEHIPKSELETSLTRATRDSSKGRYHKTRHAPDLLKRIKPDRVRDASPHCNRLFDTLTNLIVPPVSTPDRTDSDAST